MKNIERGLPQALLDCPKFTGFRNGASHAPLGRDEIVADCIVEINGNNFGSQSGQFDPPVPVADGISAEFSALQPVVASTAALIYATSPNQIVCVIPGAVFGSNVYLLDLNIPHQGPLPCPLIEGKGQLTATAPGLFTEDGSGQGPGMFSTFPDGAPQPIETESGLVQVLGTGLRHAPSLPTALVDGSSVTVSACAPDPARPGYDRLIFQLPASLTAGTHQFQVIADGKSSNVIELQLR